MELMRDGRWVLFGLGRSWLEPRESVLSSPADDFVAALGFSFAEEESPLGTGVLDGSGTGGIAGVCATSTVGTGDDCGRGVALGCMPASPLTEDVVSVLSSGGGAPSATTSGEGNVEALVPVRSGCTFLSSRSSRSKRWLFR